MWTSEIQKRIYYHDTDSGGVVYYANYLKYLEEGRTEYFLQRSLDLKTLSGEGILFVVAAIEVKYKAPARYGDIIRVQTAIEELKSSSIRFRQHVYEGQKVLVEAFVVIVCIGPDFKPRPIPLNIRQLILP